MPRNYDAFFVFGKAKKLHQKIFLGSWGGLPRSQFVSTLVSMKLALVGRGDV